MSHFMELLYHAWITDPNPEFWPEHLRDDPVLGHGQYCFHEGLSLGLLLAVEAFFPETRT